MDQNGQKRTSLGLDENVEGLLCYALGWITGLIFLLLEKDNKSVRFHSIQSLITFLSLDILGVIVVFIPFIGTLLSFIIWPVRLALWIVLMVKAYKGEMFKLPVVGEIAEQQTNKSMSV